MVHEQGFGEEELHAMVGSLYLSRSPRLLKYMLNKHVLYPICKTFGCVILLNLSHNKNLMWCNHAVHEIKCM